jgi:hypothetical protein
VPQITDLHFTFLSLTKTRIDPICRASQGNVDGYAYARPLYCVQVMSEHNTMASEEVLINYESVIAIDKTSFRGNWRWRL